MKLLNMQSTIDSMNCTCSCSILLSWVLMKCCYILLQEILQTLARYMVSYHKEVNQVSYIDIRYYIYCFR